jgi:diguanylate cyclase (GGDEF)-like protein/putative nucleotidyltransferase with HDIG domain
VPSADKPRVTPSTATRTDTRTTSAGEIVGEAVLGLTSAADLDTTMRGIAASARDALGADRATCYVVSPTQVVSSVHTTEEEPRRRAFLDRTVGLGPADIPIWRHQLSSADPLLVIEDVGSANLPAPLVGALGSGALIGVRLEHASVRAGDAPELLGTLFASYRRPRAIGEAERDAARGLANLATLTLANARLHAIALRHLEDAERRAEADPLTGLLNRRGLESRFARLVAEAVEAGRELSALVLDLDRFKLINDRYGHGAGDHALRAVARTLEAGLRPGDVVGRLGGEEFLVLLPGTGPRAAWLVGERLREALRRLDAPGVPAPTASFGVASFPAHGGSPGELMRAADSAMYDAKRMGRNRCMVFEPGWALVRSQRTHEAQAHHEGYLRAVLALAEAVDARDASTLEHSRTVAEYAAATAVELGLDDVEEVRVAGLLHDVGKVGVPDAVLRKEGPLDAEEWAEMRRHPEIGARILAHPQLDAVREWVLRHHERPDGGGYPGGLAGAAIPLEARILSVADAYEAMTADRPYRRALRAEEARAEIVRARGTQFDARVVDAFLAVLDRRGARP